VQDVNERQTIGEWFQWLAERFQDMEAIEEPVPAHIAYRGWTPT